MFWFTLLLFVAFTVAGELLRPKPTYDSPDASSLGDFQVPTAQEGRPIPVVFGTCNVKGSNVVWYGDLRHDAITEKVKTGWFSSTEYTVGYKYYLGVQHAICMGQVDSLVEIRFDDEKPSYTTETLGDKLRLNVDDPDLFGSDEDEGGVSGAIDFYYGTGTQTANDYLESVVGASLPGYRNVCYAVFRQLYVGTSSYIKAPSFIVKRCPNPLEIGYHDINGDANPAWMLYEVLTNTTWGLGLSSGLIDTASFQNAASALNSEGFGLSMVFDSQTEAQNILNEILRHIDGVIYTDPSTGLITLKLARADYIVNDLPVFNTSKVLSCEYSRGSWSETKNVVKINYIDRDDDYSTSVAQQQNLANIQGRGGEVVAETYDFKGLSNSTIANTIAARVLKTVSYPLAKIRIVANRHAWALRPGSVFKLDWVPLGVSGMVCRATRISYGNLHEGKIDIDAVEDIFAIAATAYSAPSGTQWVSPVQSPAPATAQQLVEAPYHLAGGEYRHVMAMAVRGNSQCLGYRVWSDPGGGTNYYQTGDVPVFTPSGTLQSAYLKTANGSASLDNVGFIVSPTRDMGLLKSLATDTELNRGGNLLLIDNEIMAWKTVVDNGNGTYTIRDVIRGVLDTVPADHNAGARVWFFAPGFSGLTDADGYPSDATVSAKLLPYTSKATLAIGSASQISVATSSRAWKPYPPGKVQVNGVYWPQTLYGDAVMAWTHRHRVTQAQDQKVVAQDAGNYVATPEGSYTVKVYVGGILKRTYGSLTGAAQTYTATNRTADDADGSKLTKMRIEPVNGAYTGTARELEFYMTGLGMTMGQYMGGQQT